MYQNIISHCNLKVSVLNLVDSWYLRFSTHTFCSFSHVVNHCGQCVSEDRGRNMG
jgi:hypothetical protein